MHCTAAREDALLVQLEEELVNAVLKGLQEGPDCCAPVLAVSSTAPVFAEPSENSSHLGSEALAQLELRDQTPQDKELAVAADSFPGSVSWGCVASRGLHGMSRRVELRCGSHIKVTLRLPADYPAQQPPELLGFLVKGPRGAGSLQGQLRLEAQQRLKVLHEERGCCLVMFMTWLHEEVLVNLQHARQKGGSRRPQLHVEVPVSDLNSGANEGLPS